MLSLESLKNVYIEVKGKTLICFRLSKRYKADETKAFPQDSKELLSKMV
jgi:hypothetical protein